MLRPAKEVRKDHPVYVRIMEEIAREVEKNIMAGNAVISVPVTQPWYLEERLVEDPHIFLALCASKPVQMALYDTVQLGYRVDVLRYDRRTRRFFVQISWL